MGGGNTAQGDQTHRKSKMNQVSPCPIPCVECKKRDPLDYTQWEQHKFTRKSKEELKTAVGIQLLENCILTKVVREFNPAFLMEKNPKLIDCKQTEFMIQFFGAKTPEDPSKKKGGTGGHNKKPENRRDTRTTKIGGKESHNIIRWVYTEW
ncbi:MAG: hypothetical protein ACE5HH_05825, partial [Candidatus Hydrothermarchaeales archaeon]